MTIPNHLVILRTSSSYQAKVICNYAELLLAKNFQEIYMYTQRTPTKHIIQHMYNELSTYVYVQYHDKSTVFSTNL